MGVETAESERPKGMAVPKIVLDLIERFDMLVYNFYALVGSPRFLCESLRTVY